MVFFSLLFCGFAESTGSWHLPNDDNVLSMSHWSQEPFQRPHSFVSCANQFNLQAVSKNIPAHRQIHTHVVFNGAHVVIWSIHIFYLSLVLIYQWSLTLPRCRIRTEWRPWNQLQSTTFARPIALSISWLLLSMALLSWPLRSHPSRNRMKSMLTVRFQWRLLTPTSLLWCKMSIQIEKLWTWYQSPKLAHCRFRSVPSQEKHALGSFSCTHIGYVISTQASRLKGLVMSKSVSWISPSRALDIRFAACRSNLRHVLPQVLLVDIRQPNRAASFFSKSAPRGLY